MKTFWTTFYSYKGGVGRSLALANVAALLAARGHRVVLLDFDLEAPGLDTFEEFAESKGKPGIVEYVTEFQRSLVAPDVKAYVHPITLPAHIRGKLWIMPAGRRDSHYHHLLTQIRWAELYDRGIGAPFVENWKLSIEQLIQPDYVLIDSRTGLTEVGGVCTTAFPDLVVLLFGLNEQNVQGTATVARHIREADLERQPQLHFVATPIPNQPAEKTGLLHLRREAAEKVLGVSLANSSLRYWPPAALTERLFVFDETFAEFGLARDHKALCEQIAGFNRNGLDFFSQQAEEAIKQDNLDLASKLTEILAREFPDRPESLYLRSRLARLAGDGEEALHLAQKAFEFDPAFEPPFAILRAYYERTRQYHCIEQLFERVSSVASRLPTERREGFLTEKAEYYMSIGHYDLAADGYRELLEQAKQEEHKVPLTLLVAHFNFAESHRRARRPVPALTWETVILLFENTPAVEGAPNMAANRYQAMYLPLALTGQLEKAKDCLRKAQRIAETLNELETVFTVRDYKWVKPAEFLAINTELMAALERGELWDGTRLPAEAKEKVL